MVRSIVVHPTMVYPPMVHLVIFYDVDIGGLGPSDGYWGRSEVGDGFNFSH